MKLTATQTKNLKAVWTTKVAGGLVKADDRRRQTRISKATAAKAGYAAINGNSVSGLLNKGLAREMVTTDEVNGFRVTILVLTEKGREAIGV